MLRESLKRELATSRDGDYTRALTRAVNNFLQAFPHTKRTCSAIRQAARSLAAAQRDSQGGHGGGEGAVVTARPSLLQAAQAQTDHLAARRTSDLQPGSSGEASRAPQSKGGSHASPAISLPVGKTTSAQLPPQHPHAPQLQRNAAPSASGSGSINNASSVGMESGAGGQHTPVCAAPSTRAMPRRTGSPVHTGPRTTRQQLFLPPFPTSFPPGEAFAAASITSNPGSSSSAANERPAQSGCAATLPGPAATSDTQAAASSFAARAPASSSAGREGGVAGVYGGAFTGPFVWKKPGKPPRVSTRCPTSSGRPGAPSPEPRSASTSAGASSSHRIGSGGGLSGSYRPASPTRCAPPPSPTHSPPLSRAPLAPERARPLAEPEETSSILHVGIKSERGHGIRFEYCPPNHHIAVYPSSCVTPVKITREFPPSSGVLSFGWIFVFQSGKDGSFATLQMPQDVVVCTKMIPQAQTSGPSDSAAVDIIFRSATHELSVVLRTAVKQVRSGGGQVR